MIIHLNATPDELSIENENRLSVVIEELLQSYRRGHHLVIIDRDTTRWLVARGGISSSGLSLLTRLTSEFTQTGALIRSSSALVSLRTSSCTRVVQNNEIAITFQEFLTLPLAEPATLLLENAVNDGELFIFLLDNLARRRGISRLALRLEHGGGADTGNQLRRLLCERRAVFCAIDRDSLGPSSPPSPKVRAIEKIVEQASWPLSGWAVTPGREAENFLPISVLALLQCWHGNSSREVLVRLVEAQPSEFASDGFWLHFDVKDGLTQTEVNKLSNDEKARIVNCLGKIGRSDIPLIEGFGDSVVQCWKAEPRAKSALAAAMQTESWRGAFEDFFVSMLSLFIGVPPRLV